FLPTMHRKRANYSSLRVVKGGRLQIDRGGWVDGETLDKESLAHNGNPTRYRDTRGNLGEINPAENTFTLIDLSRPAKEPGGDYLAILKAYFE
ncbi:hypothetical protein Bbelb_099830, partial [Branchiostoma belcheri]